MICNASGPGVASMTPPRVWPPSLTLAWKADVGAGYASPIVVGTRVYMFSRQEPLEVLQALKASHKKGKDSGDGLSMLLGTLSPGDVFGEMSILDGSEAMATVRTRTRAWVLLLARDEYDALIADHPQIKEHLAGVAAERGTNATSDAPVAPLFTANTRD